MSIERWSKIWKITSPESNATSAISPPLIVLIELDAAEGTLTAEGRPNRSSGEIGWQVGHHEFDLGLQPPITSPGHPTVTVGKR